MFYYVKLLHLFLIVFIFSKTFIQKCGKYLVLTKQDNGETKVTLKITCYYDFVIITFPELIFGTRKWKYANMDIAPFPILHKDCVPKLKRKKYCG